MTNALTNLHKMASITCLYEWRFKEVLGFLFLCFLTSIDFVNGQYRLTPKNTVGVEGQSAVLHCAVNSMTGVVVWNHIASGKPRLQLSIGATVDLTLGFDKSQRITVVGNRGRGEYHLRIKDVKMSDAGRYECMALVGLTRIVKRSAALRVVRQPNPGYPMCQMEPAFGLAPGMEVKLSCDTMGGKPKGVVRWGDGKRALTPKKEAHISYTRTLTAKDYGKAFICQEFTPAYKTPRTCEVIPLEIDLKVDLQPSPRVEVRPGQSVTFTCYGQGTTSFGYTWQLNDKPLPFSKSIAVFGPNGHKLKIGGITAASNNAKVSCVLTNSHGFQTRSTSVISVMSSNKPKPKPKPTSFIPRDPVGHTGRPVTINPRPTWIMGDYDVHFESELGGDHWGGIDTPSGGAMSSPAMTAMAAALVGILIGVIVAVGLILTRKYLKNNRDGSIANTLINRTHSTSIPCSSLVADHSSSDGPPMNRPPMNRPTADEYSLPPRDYPRRNQRHDPDNDDQMSYLDLRPESMASQSSNYQGLNSPRLSTYDPSTYYSDEYEVEDEDEDGDPYYSQEYYEDVLNQQTRESVYHYRFSPPVDPSDIQVRCMSADRATRHFNPR
ncbi:uncharacterized protein [Amphiura filiformis]|uniref:uncharacterized protein n=1 Tax=Amphiura filiformis TaxID=82378 RepID=UPI003B20BC62